MMKQEMPLYRAEIDQLEDKVKQSVKQMKPPKLESLKYFMKNPVKDAKVPMKRAKSKVLQIL
jgi:hypothetical protein